MFGKKKEQLLIKRTPCQLLSTGVALGQEMKKNNFINISKIKNRKQDRKKDRESKAAKKISF